MPQFLRIFLNKFKEYVVLVVLLIISLILITFNEHEDVRNVRLFSLGFFASINSAVTEISNFFIDNTAIEQLEKRNAELMLQVNKLRDYGLSISELNNELHLSETTKYNIVTAPIVSRLVSKVNGYFIISKGLSDSVNTGMPVITDKGLVGVITDVNSRYSTVRTYENSLLKIAVKDQRSNVNGLLNWNGRNLVIQNMPSTNDIELGDRVIISELSSILLPSIPIGLIAKKESTISGVLTNLVVEPFVELDKLKYVSVILAKKNNEVDSLYNRLVGDKN